MKGDENRAGIRERIGLCESVWIELCQNLGYDSRFGLNLLAFRVGKSPAAYKKFSRSADREISKKSALLPILSEVFGVSVKFLIEGIDEPKWWKCVVAWNKNVLENRSWRIVNDGYSFRGKLDIRRVSASELMIIYSSLKVVEHESRPGSWLHRQVSGLMDRISPDFHFELSPYREITKKITAHVEAVINSSNVISHSLDRYHDFAFDIFPAFENGRPLTYRERYEKSGCLIFKSILEALTRSAGDHESDIESWWDIVSRDRENVVW